MSIERRKVYTLLELITLSRLMTEDDVKASLKYLERVMEGQDDPDKKIFEAMYEKLRIKEDNMNKVFNEEDHSGLIEVLKGHMSQQLHEAHKENIASKVAWEVGKECSISDRELNTKIREKWDAKFPGIQLYSRDIESIQKIIQDTYEINVTKNKSR